MPVTFAAPPPNASAILPRGLAALAGEGRMALPPHPVLRGPMAVYSLEASALAREHGLREAKLVGWRWLVGDGLVVSKAVELSADPDGSGRFYGVVAGPSVPGAARALALAQQLPEAAYEARSLRVAGIAGQALWIRCEADPTLDRFFVLPLVFKPLEEGRAYAAGELLPHLRQMLGHRLAAQERMKAGGP